MSIQQMLLEQKLKQQERAMKAEERAQQNIIKKIALPSDAQNEKDPRVLKSMIAKQIAKMDEMLHDYAGIQQVLNNQNTQMGKMERLESAGHDATIIQLQKELEDISRKYRDKISIQRSQLAEVDRYRHTKIVSKVQLGQKALTDIQSQKQQLAKQQQKISVYDLRTLFEIFQTRFNNDQQKLQEANIQVQNDIQNIDTQIVQMIEQNLSSNEKYTKKIKSLQNEIKQLKEKLSSLNADVDFINRCSYFVEHEKNRKQKMYTAMQQQTGAQK